MVDQKIRRATNCGATYQLDFGDAYQWQAVVTNCKLNEAFELQMTDSNDEWTNTKIGFVLSDNGENVLVAFCHEYWRSESDNYKFSNYCWTMYLRILKRKIEY